MLSSLKDSKKALTVGILGGGQLAKMMALEAYRLGMNVAIIEKGEGTPAGDMTKLDFTSGWNDREELDRFIAVSDVVTLENEFIDTAILEYIEGSLPVFPSSATMKKVQDKYIQKKTFGDAGLDVADFAEISNEEDALEFAGKYGYPFLIKTRTLGYDGYGNFTVRKPEDIGTALSRFTKDGALRPLMAERFIDFTKELAVMVARNTEGQVEVYPCVETVQENHICHKVTAPAPIEEGVGEKARAAARKCVEAVNGVGVFGIELFLTRDDKILVNEIAPRPHNSGHYTIEACYTSQYENALLAINGLPLGSSEMIKPAAVMINLLGEREGAGVPYDIMEMINDNSKLHLYNKKSSRPGRKMGHITALGDTPEEAEQRASASYEKFRW